MHHISGWLQIRLEVERRDGAAAPRLLYATMCISFILHKLSISVIVFVFVFLCVCILHASALCTVCLVLSSLAFVRTFGSTDTQAPTLTVISTTFSYSGCNLFYSAFFSSLLSSGFCRLTLFVYPFYDV